MLDLLGRFAGRALEVDEEVYRSECDTGHWNRAITYMMLNSGMIGGDALETLDLYFRQCSVRVTARDLAVMAADARERRGEPADRRPAARAGRGARRADGDDDLRHVQLCRPVGLRGRDAGEERRLRLRHRGDPRADRHRGLLAAPRQLRQQRARRARLPRASRGGSGCTCSATGRASARWSAARSAATPSPPSGGGRSRKRAVLEADGRQIVLLELQGALFFGSAERLIRRVAALGPRCAS